MEPLSPLERAAFLLHDVFGASFEEIAQTLQRDPAACRQLASRARTHVRASRPRFHVMKERGLEWAAAAFTASRRGDLETLRLMASLARLFVTDPSRLVRYSIINGLPGFVTMEQGATLQTTALAMDAGKIVAIYVVRNPERVAHLRTEVM